jgi:alanine dehydrogenase
MKIGIKKEVKIMEGRVALIPTDVRRLIQSGHEVSVEDKAGINAGFSNEDYIAAGASIVSTKEVWSKDLLISVKEPIENEFKWFREDLTIFSYLHLAALPFLTNALVKAGTTAIALESVEMNGRLPGLDPMSTIAGRIAGQLAVRNLYRDSGGNGILLGGVHGTDRGKALVVGGGVAGMSAAKELASFGTRVLVVDNNPTVVDRINESQIENSVDITADDISYTEELYDTDVLIGAVLIPGRITPKVVSEDAIKGMPDGSVAIDIGIDQGGCIETAILTDWENPTYVTHGVTHLCIPNLPGIVPRTSSEAISKVILPQAIKIANEKYDEGLTAAVSIVNHEILDKRIL